MTADRALAVVVLAAGRGTRMKSARAKVLHEVFYRPMLDRVLASIAPLAPERTVVVVGHQKEAVIRLLEGSGASWCEQGEQRGTGHAVQCCAPSLAGFSGDVMIVNGDAPLLLPEHLQAMVEHHRRSGGRLTVMTTALDDPTGYGRIITDGAGTVTAVVEEKDATPEQRAIDTVNAGIYCVEASFLFEALGKITADNSQGELYLTDIVAIGALDGVGVTTFTHPIPAHVLGVNSKVDLAQAHRELRQRRNRQLMRDGVTIEDPDTVTVAPMVRIGADCRLTAGLSLLGASVIGAGCTIEPGAFISDSRLGDNVVIGANCVIIDSIVGPGRAVEPLTAVTGARIE